MKRCLPVLDFPLNLRKPNPPNIGTKGNILFGGGTKAKGTNLFRPKLLILEAVTIFRLGITETLGITDVTGKKGLVGIIKSETILVSTTGLNPVFEIDLVSDGVTNLKLVDTRGSIEVPLITPVVLGKLFNFISGINISLAAF